MERTNKVKEQPEQVTTVHTIGEAVRPADITEAVDRANNGRVYGWQSHPPSSEDLITELNQPQ